MSQFFALRRALPLLGTVIAVACQSTPTTPPPGPQVATVEIQPTPLSLALNETTQLQAIARNAGGSEISGLTASWTSTEPTIATVDQSGTLTGISTGQSQITATIDGATGSASVTVVSTPAPVATVVVTPTTMGLTVGQTGTLTVVAQDASGNVLPGRPVTWTSDQSSVASVTGGTVTGHSAGVAIINATVETVVGSATATVLAPGGSSIAIQPAVTYQTMLGWEATVELGQSDIPTFTYYRDEVVDRLVNELGINRVRLEVRSGVENPTNLWQNWQDGIIDYSTWRANRYVVVNDNGDPNTINPSGFQFSELDWGIEQVLNPMRALMAANGEPLWINLCLVDFRGSSNIITTNPSEYAEFMLAVFQHIQSKYGWVPNSIEVILEPDNNTPYSGSRIGANIAAAATRLAAAGYSPDFVAPSTTSMLNAPAYFDDIIAQPGALAALSEISYHRYSRSLSSLQEIASRAAANNLRTAHLEWIGATYHELHEDITVGMNSAWSQYVMAQPLTSTGASDDGGKYYIVDDGNPTAPVVSMGWRTPFLRQYMYYVREGAVRLGATSTDGTLEPVAFRNLDGRFIVVVKAAGGATLSVAGLPTGTYGRSYSTASESNRELGEIGITAGELVPIDIPSAGVATIYQK